jgi:hypothetical protein
MVSCITIWVTNPHCSHGWASRLCDHLFLLLQAGLWHHLRTCHTDRKGNDIRENLLPAVESVVAYRLVLDPRDSGKVVHGIGLEVTVLLIALEILIYTQLRLHGFRTMTQYTIPSSITGMQLYRSRPYYHSQQQYRSRGWKDDNPFSQLTKCSPRPPSGTTLLATL